MPLLQDGQDPDGLAALVAYHLHRLCIPTKHLTQSGMYRETARQLRRGTLQIGSNDLRHLTAVLQMDTRDLARPLTEDEKTEWNFYRLSARQVTETWRRVAEASSAHNLSQHQIGDLLQISQSAVSRAISGERKSPVLTWQQATTIANALDLADGPETFIESRFVKENGQQRR